MHVPRSGFGPVLLAGLVTLLSEGVSRAESYAAIEQRPGVTAPPPSLRFDRAPGESHALVRLAAGGATRYSIGDPTDDEQLYLEYINRARANPRQEGQRLRASTDPDLVATYAFFQVDLNLMANQFANISPTPPLSFNGSLTAAARLHSQDMLTHQFQGHTGSDGSTLDLRVTNQGYDWSALAENVYASAKAVLYGHASFEVDWGGPASAGGMQDPPGHRVNIHSDLYREAGIGVVNGTSGSFGPQVVTQDFGSRDSLTPFITGVVYYDFNGNGFYDLGEGIGGVTVTVGGVSSFAVTGNSGGYSVPVPGNGSYPVTFTAGNLSNFQTTVVIVRNENSKQDYVPAYSPPAISGPATAAINQNNPYSLTPVGAATAYQWLQSRLVPFISVEGAENGLGNVTVTASPGYSVVANDVKAAGSFSFHLAHPQAVEQTLELNRTFRASAASQLTFFSRLGWATSGQIARAQVSSDSGVNWQDVWTKAGTGNSGDSAFSKQTIPLSAFAGTEIRVRFVYDQTSGSFFNQTSDGVGLYLDDISLTGADEVVATVIADIPSGTLFSFSPGQAANYSLRARAKVSNRFLAWGPVKLVTAEIGTVATSVKVTRIQLMAGNQVQIDFEVVTGAATSFQLETLSQVPGNWAADLSASIQPVQSPTKFRAVTQSGGTGQRYFRIAAR